MEPVLYKTLVNSDNSEHFPVKKNNSFSEMIPLFLVGGCGCLCILIVFSIPTLSIVFSQVFPWQENDSVCDSKNHALALNVTSGVYDMQPVKCTCRADFPKYMLVEGVLEIITLSLVVAGACCFYMAKDSEDREGQVRAVATKGSDSKYGIAICFLCSAVLCYVACFTITIMMLDSMFWSNKKCGESLWWYGIFLCVFFGILSLPALMKILQCKCFL
jgi:hypothetical protein